MNPINYESGQVSSEYALLLVGILLVILTASYAIDRNLIEYFSDEVTSNLLSIITLLKLPI